MAFQRRVIVILSMLFHYSMKTASSRNLFVQDSPAILGNTNKKEMFPRYYMHSNIMFQIVNSTIVCVTHCESIIKKMNELNYTMIEDMIEDIISFKTKTSYALVPDVLKLLY